MNVNDTSGGKIERRTFVASALAFLAGCGGKDATDAATDVVQPSSAPPPPPAGNLSPPPPSPTPSPPPAPTPPPPPPPPPPAAAAPPPPLAPPPPYTGARPAWRTAMAAMTWAEVGSNTIDSLNPRFNPAINPIYPSTFLDGMQSAVVGNWCGACWVEGEHKLYVGPGGGHNDYYGNETYIWDATSADFSLPPTAWPTGSIGFSPGYAHRIDGLQATGKYADGRVRSYHSYGNFATRRGREAWFFGGAVGAPNIDATNKSAIWRWEGSNWVDKSGFVIDGNVAGGACWDERRDIFYVVGPGTPGGVSSYDPNTNRWANTGRASNCGNYAQPAYEPIRDLLVVLTSTQRPTLFRVARMNAPGESLVAVPTTGEIPPSSEPSAEIGRGAGTNGFVYARHLDLFLMWQGGKTIFTLKPPPIGSDPLTTAWTWGRIDDASSTVTPGPAEFNGTYGRFWYSNAWKCCGVFNATTQRMHVFALE